MCQNLQCEGVGICNVSYFFRQIKHSDIGRLKTLILSTMSLSFGCGTSNSFLRDGHIDPGIVDNDTRSSQNIHLPSAEDEARAAEIITDTVGETGMCQTSRKLGTAGGMDTREVPNSPGVCSFGTFRDKGKGTGYVKFPAISKDRSLVEQSPETDLPALTGPGLQSEVRTQASLQDIGTVPIDTQITPETGEQNGQKDQNQSTNGIWAVNMDKNLVAKKPEGCSSDLCGDQNGGSSQQSDCVDCLSGFISRSLLLNHLQTHQEKVCLPASSVLSFTCEFCSLVFYPEEFLTKHACQKDTTLRPFVCVSCDKRFRCKASLRVHTKTQHHVSRQLPCKECGKAFHQASDLRRHELTHTGVRPFICEECEKGFTCRSSLTAHMRSAHTIGKLLQCPVCQKGFHLLSDMKRHIRTHTGERPFNCDQCQKGFTCKSSLRAHQKVHTLGKPFSCKFCPKSFHLEVDLSRHERTHTGDKPFKCELCQKNFVCKSTLSMHRKLIHMNRVMTDSQTEVDQGYKARKGSKRPTEKGDISEQELSELLSSQTGGSEIDMKSTRIISADNVNRTEADATPCERKRQRKSLFVQRLVVGKDVLVENI